MKAKLFFGLVVFLALGAVAQAQVFSIVVTEAEVIAQTGEPAWDPEGLCVAPNGNIYIVDAQVVGNDRIIKVVPGSPNTVSVLTTEDDIVAAIDAVNGTGDYTDFSFTGQAVAADGDLILVNGDSASAESVVAVNQTSGAITVIYTPVTLGGISDIEAAVSMTVMGNTAYIGRYEGFGASDNDIVMLDTNDASAPSAAVTTLADGPTIQAANGTSFEENVSALANDGVDLFGSPSGTGGTSDHILKITAAGVVSLHVDATDIEADLGDTDIGVSGLAVDNGGRFWFDQAYGGTIYDDGVVLIQNAGAGVGDATGFTEATIISDLGITDLSIQSGAGPVAYDRQNHRVLFTTGNFGSDNIVYAANVGVLMDVKDWQEY